MTERPTENKKMTIALCIPSTPYEPYDNILFKLYGRRLVKPSKVVVSREMDGATVYHHHVWL